ncbi:uncharacterized protein FA14DRAFT_78753 [Meira miltonrushii]|uniref:Uncharacterized protein n=1 Tax=Meira miltonrushii TaxID=1280837 RepID=A0A316V5T7_9BASI|nr:uncharacterized protein FA14DRAFT_78753 [Meira miltonrushii]PWN32856.1 hypothetical protein FA14DRAFT_78753 [Meira miltonrushii]
MNCKTARNFVQRADQGCMHKQIIGRQFITLFIHAKDAPFYTIFVYIQAQLRYIHHHFILTSLSIPPPIHSYFHHNHFHSLFSLFDRHQINSLTMSKPASKTASAAKKASSTGPSYEVSLKQLYTFFAIAIRPVDKVNGKAYIGAKRNDRYIFQAGQWMDGSMYFIHSKPFGSISSIRFTPSSFVRSQFARAFRLTRRDWSAWMVYSSARSRFLHG